MNPTVWDSLIVEADIAALLPGEATRFARPVQAALVYFLKGLPPHEQREILLTQAELGLHATMAQRLGRLARCCPVLHKLGQTLARDARLSAELRAELQPLESLPPSLPMEAIERAIEVELGPDVAATVRLRPPALAEASVAVVVPFDYGDDYRRHGVFKLLKPGIEQRLSQELVLLQGVGDLLDERCHELGIPSVDYREAFDEVAARLNCEVDLEGERRHLALAARLYAGDRDAVSPAPLQFSAPRVIAMERIFGIQVSDAELKHAPDRRALGRRMFRALVIRPLLSRGETAIFHFDPHPGNLFVTPERRIAILDWSLVGELSETARTTIVQLCLAGLLMDGGRIEAFLRQLGRAAATQDAALQRCVAAAVSRVYRGRLPGLTWLVELLDDVVQNAGLRLPGQLVMFRKQLLALSGTVRELDEQFNMDAVLMRNLLWQLVKETPARWFTAWGSRNLPTRIATTDFIEAALSGPLLAAKYWLQATR